MSQQMEKVQEIIADALYVEKEECGSEATLMGDLGAESIDFLDIIFRLEQEFSIKLPKGEIEKQTKGNLTDDEFAVNGVLQPAAIENLRSAMPEIGTDSIKDGIMVRDIPGLFTVGTFDRMVSEKTAPATSDAASTQQANK